MEMPSFGSPIYYHCGTNHLNVNTMEKTDLIKDQKLLMAVLMEATRNDYYSAKDAPKGEITAGANATNFSLRNTGSGIPLEQMVRALYPLEGEEGKAMSLYYPIEALVGADVLEVHSFRRGEHATLRYEKGKRVSLNIEPDTVTPEGVLIRVEWGGGLAPDKILRKEDLLTCLQGIEGGWKPALFFNGERIVWAKLDINK